MTIHEEVEPPDPTALTDRSSTHAAGRVAIISNRGPNDFVWEDGRWVTRTSTGGLVSMLEPLARQPDVVWFCCVSEPPGARSARRRLFTTAADQTDSDLHIVPVPLPAPLYHAYYGQISNEVLWMLQHQVIGPGGYERLDAPHHQAWLTGYVEANRRLAAAVASTCPDARALLVQDYHLYPLPAMLRAAFPETPILHFTHIPFPEPSILRLIPTPWREAILRGLLGADVVGLQTEADVRAFLACCQMLPDLGVDPASATVLHAGRRVSVRAYGASVNPDALQQTMRSPAVQAASRRFEARGRRTLIRVDRLDPSKNQSTGFLAFARLLELRPDLRRELRFLAFLIPSRTDLGVYRAYRDRIYRTIDAINERYQEECGGPPIEVFYTNDREQALAAMERCDVLLVNSLKDGMNLVAKEWAIVSERPGVLIVSETAGVAEAAEGCGLMVSPLDVEGTARAMGTALDMPAAERTARLDRFRARIEAWTAEDWLAAQLADLGLSLPEPADAAVS
jgi:trehalose 6-phosphate synthase